MPRLSQRTKDARREQILGAARRCFARNGFHATSMQDIFDASGLSAGAVYSHFSGKNEIVAAIADGVIDTISATVTEALDLDQPAALADVVGQVCAALCEADVAAIAVSVWGEAVRDPELARRQAAKHAAMRDHFARLAAAHQRLGTIDGAVPADDVGAMLTGLVQGFVCQRALGADVDARTFARGLGAVVGARP